MIIDDHLEPFTFKIRSLESDKAENVIRTNRKVQFSFKTSKRIKKKPLNAESTFFGTVQK